MYDGGYLPLFMEHSMKSAHDLVAAARGLAADLPMHSAISLAIFLVAADARVAALIVVQTSVTT